MKYLYLKTSILFIISTILVPSIHAVNYTWNGGGGEWNTDTNWTPTGIPGASDSATVNSGTVSITGEISIGTLTLSSASLTGNGTLTITTMATLTQSVMQGSGTTLIATGATMTLSGNSDHQLNNRTLAIEGTLNHGGTGRLLLASSTIDNRSGGVIDLQNDSSWAYWANNTPTFINAGILKILSGETFTLTSFASITNTGSIDLTSGSLTFESSDFNNQGDVLVDSGLLKLSGGGTSNGEWNVAEGAFVEFNAGTPTVIDGSSFIGAGLYRITGATVNFDSAVTVPRLELVTGDISGTGILTIGNSLQWTGGGTSKGSGTTLVAHGATMTLSGNSDHQLNDRTLAIEGTVIHQGTGRLLLASSAIENRSGGVIDLQSDSSWAYWANNAPTFSNAGTISKTAGSGESVFKLAGNKVHNTGTIEAQSGTISFETGISGSGSFVAADQAQILFKNHSELENVSFSGAGLIKMPSHTLTLSGTCSSENFELNQAILRGTHTLQGTWNLVRATIENPGTTTVAAGAFLNLLDSGDHQLNGHTLAIEGTLNHIGTGRLLLASSTIDNRLGGLIDLQIDSSWAYWANNKPILINAGTFQILDGQTFTLKSFNSITNTGSIELVSGSLTFESSDFNNEGEVLVDSGQMKLSGGGTSNGEWNVAQGAFVEFNGGGPTIDDGSTFEGEGLYRITGATVNFDSTVTVPRLELVTGDISGTGILTIGNSLQWTGGGTSKGSGTTLVTLGATMTLSGNSDHQLNDRTLAIEGTVIHQGTGRLLLASSAIENRSGGVIDLQSDSSWAYWANNAPTFSNAGTIMKTAGSGESVFKLAGNKVHNTGTIEAQSGTISFETGVSGGGSFVAADQAQILFKNHSGLENVSFSGAGLIKMPSHTLTLSGTCSSENFELNSAILTGTHTLQGTWSLVSGKIEGSGTTTVAAGAFLNLLDSGDHQLNGHTIVIEGTLNHIGTGRLLLASSTIDNRPGGVIDLQTDSRWSYWANNAPTISNAGILKKSGGSGESYFSLASNNVHNTGTIEVHSGTINFNTGASGDGTFHARAGTQVLYSGNSAFSGVKFSGPGIQWAKTGTLNLEGDCYADNFEFAGARLTGTQALSGTWHWSSGEFRGPGSTTIKSDGLLRIITDSDHVFNSRNLINNGVVAHIGTGHVVAQNQSRLENTANGILVLSSNSQWRDGGGTASTLINAGTVYQTSGATTTFHFNNLQDTGTYIAEDIWIEDPEHGWIFITGFNGYGYYVYDWAVSAWAWYPFHHYPYMYYFGYVDSWTWHVAGTATPDRWFYYFEDEPGWLFEDDMRP